MAEVIPQPPVTEMQTSPFMPSEHRGAFLALGVGAGATALAAGMIAFGESASATPGTEHKVTICHRTDSVTNPYVRETVDVASVDGNTSNDHGKGDHLAEHQGPLASSEAVAQTLKDSGQKWGDIIPSLYADGTPDGLPSLNWPAGETMFDNNCNYVTGTSTSPTPSPSESTSKSESPSPSGSTSKSTSNSPSPSNSTSNSTSPTKSMSTSASPSHSSGPPTSTSRATPPSHSTTPGVPPTKTSFEGPGTAQSARLESYEAAAGLLGLGGAMLAGAFVVGGRPVRFGGYSKKH